MSFVARPPAAEITAEPPVLNDGFFPDIDLAAVRDAARIPTTITGSRVRAAILGAILTIGIDLAAFKAASQAAGHATLADVPADQLDGQSIQSIRYLRAIALYAKAEMIERHRDFDTTGAGGSLADELSASIGDLRRDAQHAVRDIVGRTRTVVELI